MALGQCQVGVSANTSELSGWVLLHRCVRKEDSRDWQTYWGMFRISELFMMG